MADVQTENGFTRIAHEILENMAKIKLSPTQYRLIFVIWRYTYGFKRTEHDMSLSFLSEATGCDKRSIQRDLKRLEDRKVIFQNIKDGSYRKISFNKDYDQWDSTIGKTTNGDSANGKTTIGETANPTIGSSTNGTIGETANQDRYIDKSIDNKKEEESASRFYQDNGFGHLGGYAAEMMMQWMEKMPESVIILAMKEAVKRDAKKWSYLNRVLEDWHSRGYTTKESVEAAIKQHEQRGKMIPFKQPNNKRKEDVQALLDKYREV